MLAGDCSRAHRRIGGRGSLLANLGIAFAAGIVVYQAVEGTEPSDVGGAAAHG